MKNIYDAPIKQAAEVALKDFSQKWESNSWSFLTVKILDIIFGFVIISKYFFPIKTKLLRYLNYLLDLKPMSSYIIIRL